MLLTSPLAYALYGGREAQLFHLKYMFLRITLLFCNSFSVNDVFINDMCKSNLLSTPQTNIYFLLHKYIFFVVN